jgi:hypothetical protein
MPNPSSPSSNFSDIISVQSKAKSVDGEDFWGCVEEQISNLIGGSEKKEKSLYPENPAEMANGKIPAHLGQASRFSGRVQRI